MAGLQQYYFFPTDFFYPRPQSSVHADTAQKSAVSLQIQKPDISKDLKNPTSLSLVLYTNNHPHKASAAINITKSS
ncbi:hypothetical protein MANES_09G009700v8 [Manihot esculenta]|uniref:Uncharacterized protein n=1 Tax=Manihot esculenta TaxID=3983 RepID=A0A2C9V6R8_MANES|nr:hypothetical protein MANES_09G009700v8 [Manihot esculenta]